MINQAVPNPVETQSIVLPRCSRERLGLWLVPGIGAALVAFASPAAALAVGILVALCLRPAPSAKYRLATKWLLQGSVILLGFSMNLPEVLRVGVDGAVFSAVSIAVTLALGLWLGRWFQIERKPALLLAAGTAICGGSAIAAVSAVIAASEAEIAVAIGTVFLLNAVALYVFPLAGHLLHLNPSHFGVWAGVSIHDISSVVGAALRYGPGTLETATAIKLSRTLWIIPLTLGIAWHGYRRTNQTDRSSEEFLGFGSFLQKFRTLCPPSLCGSKATSAPQHTESTRPKIAIPWFIGLFLLASLLRTYFPALADFAPVLSAVAKKCMVAVLFLVGTALSLAALRQAGWRMILTGAILWITVSAGTLATILIFAC
jgi:uncharacterized membrane protein YadS